MKLAKFPPGVAGLGRIWLGLPPTVTNKQNTQLISRPRSKLRSARPPSANFEFLIRYSIENGGAKKENWRQHVLKWTGSTREVLGELNCLPEERSEFWACVKLGNLPLSRIHYRWEQYELFSTMSHSIIPLFFGGLAKCKFRHFWRITFEMIS